jgi:hypothetical protein
VSIIAVNLGGGTLDVAGVLLNAGPSNFLLEDRDPLKSYNHKSTVFGVFGEIGSGHQFRKFTARSCSKGQRKGCPK